MTQAECWKRLHEVYDERGLTLALGSGVSYGCGLPNWEKLLRRLARNTPQGNKVPLYELLKEDGYSLPAIASVLETFYGKKEFTEAVKEQLYKKFPYKDGVKGRARAPFVESVKSCNLTLASVASLCALREEQDRFVPNPRIHAIINTNYDSIFRAYMGRRYRMSRKRPNSLGADHLVRSIERPSAGSKYGRIPVYYVHGFIRFDTDTEDMQSGAADLRVLTEQEFFNFFNNPNGMFNYSFLHLLREHPCLFIGMSMKDDNVRRLLYYSKKERKAAYMTEGKSEADAERKSVRHFAILKRPAGGGDLADATCISLKRLGVTVLWVDDHEEIHDRLRDLYESTSPAPRWKEVF